MAVKATPLDRLISETDWLKQLKNVVDPIRDEVIQLKTMLSVFLSVPASESVKILSETPKELHGVSSFMWRLSVGISTVIKGNNITKSIQVSYKLVVAVFNNPFSAGTEISRGIKMSRCRGSQDISAQRFF